MTDTNTLLSKIEAAIKALPLDKKTPQGLYAPILYTLESGGKRIRPLLCCQAAEVFGCDGSKALVPAVAIELYHNHTLLHDDLMDASPLRRNRPSVHKKWSPNAAILSGDAMLIAAYEHLSTMTDGSALARVLPVFCQMCLAVCEGQQLDMEFETRSDVSEEEYIEMISLKTSALIGYALQMGALTANASDADAQQLYLFGLYLGITFQLQDDLLDTFGDESTLGKPIGGDIIQNKKTILSVKAREAAFRAGTEEYQSIVSLPKEQSEEKIQRMRQLYTGFKIDEETHQLINHYNSLALDALKPLQTAGYHTEELSETLASLVGRQK